MKLKVIESLEGKEKDGETLTGLQRDKVGQKNEVKKLIKAVEYSLKISAKNAAR